VLCACKSADSQPKSRISKDHYGNEEETIKPEERPKTPSSEEVCLIPPDAEVNTVDFLKVGQKAPDFTLASVRGDGDIKLTDFRGKTTVIIFWASWCPACRKNAELFFKPLQAQIEKTKSTKVAILGVGLNAEGDTAKAQKDYAEAKDFHWALAYDADVKVEKTYGPIGIPTAVVLDGEGKVVTYGQFKGAWGQKLQDYLFSQCTMNPDGK
jgi:peroxiredoxin